MPVALSVAVDLLVAVAMLLVVFRRPHLPVPPGWCSWPNNRGWCLKYVWNNPRIRGAHCGDNFVSTVRRVDGKSWVVFLERKQGGEHRVDARSGSGLYRHGRERRDLLKTRLKLLGLLRLVQSNSIVACELV